MRVLLVNTNRERAPQPVAPLGLGLVAAATATAGHEVRLLDLCFSRRPDADLVRVLRDFAPEAIGLSIRNLDNGERLRPRSHVPEAVRLAQVCRAHSNATLIIGGAAVNVAPEEMRRRLGADHAVVGEGEVGLPEALTARGAGLEPALPARAGDLDTLPHVEAGRWVDLPRYLRQGAQYPLQTKRGCAFRCTYCSYPQIEGECYRFRSSESVCAEVEAAIRRWRVRHFEVVDATFNHPLERTLELCEALARRDFRASLHTMGLNPSCATRELFAAMRRAGFRSAVCAVESGSDRMLDSMRKGFTAQQAAQTAAWAREAGLPVLWAFMFGAPGESEETVRETVRFMETALGPRDRMICAVGVRVYPRTELARVAEAEGAITTGTDLSEPVFYPSQVAAERVLQLLEASSARDRMVLLETIQRPAVAWAMRLRGALHLPGAPWASVPLYNRAMRLFGRRR